MSSSYYLRRQGQYTSSCRKRCFQLQFFPPFCNCFVPLSTMEPFKSYNYLNGRDCGLTTALPTIFLTTWIRLLWQQTLCPIERKGWTIWKTERVSKTITNIYFVSDRFFFVKWKPKLSHFVIFLVKLVFGERKMMRLTNIYSAILIFASNKRKGWWKDNVWKGSP